MALAHRGQCTCPLTCSVACNNVYFHKGPRAQARCAPQPPTPALRALASLCDGGGSPTGVGLARGGITPSTLVPYMLRLPPDAHATLSLHSHPLTTSGRLVLQDLPSALPAHALLGEAGAARAARFIGGLFMRQGHR